MAFRYIIILFLIVLAHQTTIDYSRMGMVQMLEDALHDGYLLCQHKMFQKYSHFLYDSEIVNSKVKLIDYYLLFTFIFQHPIFHFEYKGSCEIDVIDWKAQPLSIGWYTSFQDLLEFEPLNS